MDQSIAFRSQEPYTSLKTAFRYRKELVRGCNRLKILIDLSPVTYVDSATIGCLMDLYRQVHNAGGHLKLSGVQKRVETMLTMTGAQNFLEIHADEPTAVKSFGA